MARSDPYHFEWRYAGGTYWANPPRGLNGVANSFPDYDTAAYHANKYAAHYGVVTAVFHGNTQVFPGNVAVSDRPGKDTTVDKPLNVTRTKLIKALEDAQTRIQNEADEKRAKALAAFDERVKLYRENATAEKLDRCLIQSVENGEYVGPKHAAVATDETIEKQLRVLKLSEDKTVEVTPTDSFYKHL